MNFPPCLCIGLSDIWIGAAIRVDAGAPYIVHYSSGLKAPLKTLSFETMWALGEPNELSTVTPPWDCIRMIIESGTCVLRDRNCASVTEKFAYLCETF